jgi:phosphoglucomutase
MFAQVIAATLQASGLEVLYGDAAATPTTGVLVRHHGAVAGIQISASHNPPPYNGIKLFGPDGRVIPAAAGEQVIEQFHARSVRWVSHDQLGSYSQLSDTTSAHLEKVLATVDVAAIRRRKFRVVLDSNHGAGAVLGDRLLQELGCDVTLLGPKPDGLFENPPEPTADNLRSTAERAVKLSADAVFCQDPDADRLALIDERDHWRTLQQWWIRSFRQPLHQRWITAAVMARAIPSITVQQFVTDPERYQAVSFKPRGWSWVDPTKEVNAYKEAIRAGFTTVTDVIAATGGGHDLEDVLTTRKRELEMFEEAGIEVDTTISAVQTPAPEPAELDPPEDDELDPEAATTEDPPARVFSIARS